MFFHGPCKHHALSVIQVLRDFFGVDIVYRIKGAAGIRILHRLSFRAGQQNVNGKAANVHRGLGHRAIQDAHADGRFQRRAGIKAHRDNGGVARAAYEQVVIRAFSA